MALPLFSEMLAERRRQLGLPISQCSSVLRLKEDVLIAFEQGDFDGIPKSGYAQGMLSSYARYLGLDAKDVVEQFSEDLYEYNMAQERMGGRQDTRRAAGAVSEAYPSSRRTTVESRGLLPTSGGFAGDMGDFATTSRPRPRSHYDGYGSYDDDSEQMSSWDVPYDQDADFDTPRGYELSPTPLGQVERTTSRTGRSRTGERGNSGRARRQRSSREGRAGSRSGSSGRTRSTRGTRNAPREGTRSRKTRDTRRQGGRSRNTQPNDLRHILAALLDDRRFLLGGAVVLVALVIGLVAMLGMRACSMQSKDTSHTVTLSSQNDTASAEGESSVEASGQGDDERVRAEALAKATEKETLAAERKIAVTVAEDAVPWVEIECDGKSEVADQVTGPWSKTFTVTKMMTISVDDPAAVTVTENDKPLEFDAKASGVGTITVEAAGKDADTSDADAEQQGETGEQGSSGEEGISSSDQNEYADGSEY